MNWNYKKSSTSIKDRAAGDVKQALPAFGLCLTALPSSVPLDIQCDTVAW